MSRGALCGAPVVALALLTGTLTVACQLRPPPAAAAAARVADSLVLERTPCYGRCPAYRLSLSAAGGVTFESRNSGESTRAVGTVPQATLATLVRRAEAFGFFELPARLVDDKSLCADWATDHPTVVLSIFRVAGVKVVEDYHGCFARPDHSVVDVVGRLRAFETAVDSATDARRWIRPARFRSRRR